MRPEPRSMTLGDAMAMSVGVAAAFGVARSGGIGFLPGTISPSGMFFLMILVIIWALGMAISGVILGRSMRYHRPSGPGEWLALLLAAMGIVEMVRNRFLFAEQPLVRSWGIDFTTARSIIAAGWTALFAVGLGSIYVSRRHLPAGIITTLGLGLAVIAIGGPIDMIQKEGRFWIGPTGGFATSPRGLLLMQACELIASTPLALMFALPTAAMAARRSRRTAWVWTAWAGPILCLPTVGYLFFLRPTFFPAGSGYWLADRAFGLVWIVGTFVLARWIVMRWDRAGREEFAQRPEMATSPASTRAT